MACTAAAATAAWDRIRFRPRILRDVSSVSTATTVLGQELTTPVCVAPTAMHRAAHPMGEVATARGAAAAGSLMQVSTNSGMTFEQIGTTGAQWWLQSYVFRDRGLTTAILHHAQPHYGLINLAQRLVVPLVSAGVGESLLVNHF